MRRRHTSEEERALFQEAFVESRPLKKDPKSHPKPTPVPVSPTQRGRTGGLDGNTAERLRKGALEPEARIDLHGMTAETAHRALLSFLRGARRNGAKLVLVVTGKGGRKPAADAPFDMEQEQRARGVLKALTPRWLAEPAFAELIAESRSAHRKHGGTGAMYIYLRKKRD